MAPWGATPTKGLDFSLFKSFKIKAINEESRLQLRFEIFNPFDRVNFGQPAMYSMIRFSVAPARPLARARSSSA